jgi:hypothetical protein
LRKESLAASAIDEALQQALWGEDAGDAAAAATYLVNRGQREDRGVARGIVLGGIFGHESPDESGIHIWTLLTDPESRIGVMGALRALLFGEERGYMLNIASMLIVAGEPLSDRILSECNSEYGLRHAPYAPLAALALSGRVDEAREKAHTLKLDRLVALIGDEPLVVS